MPKKRGLPAVRDAVDNYKKNIEATENPLLAELAKLKAQAELFKAELLDNDDDSDTLSVTATMMLMENVKKVREKAEDAEKSFKLLHAPESHLGKVIDKNLVKEIHGLVRNEKDLEGDAKSQRLINGLICDHLMSSGYTRIAETLCDEANLGSRIDTYKQNKAEYDNVLDSFKEKNVIPAIEWLEKYESHRFDDLKNDLRRQHGVKLIEDGDYDGTLAYCRTLAKAGHHQIVAKLMGAMMLRKAGKDHERYADMFEKSLWEELEERTSTALTQFDSNLAELMRAGSHAVSSLVGLKQRIYRQDHLFTNDELPLEVPGVDLAHSVFTCPILRQQTTEHNPPMRLTCGHVISRDALNRLGNSSRYCNIGTQTLRFGPRHFRLKCPYCPKESKVEEAKRVQF